MITGRRDAAPVDLELSNTFASIEELCREVLAALEAKDQARLLQLKISPEEFETVFWPEFPQSRPYVRMVVGEVWGFHLARCLGGTSKAISRHGGRRLALLGVDAGEVKTYTNFKLHDRVVMRVEDRDTGEQLELAMVQTVAERHGRYKVYIYLD